MDKQYGTKNVYLVGLMGAGKTTIGRALAKRLNLDFVDSDHEIEVRTGVSIPTVFEIEGEEGFRRREAQVIADLSRLSGQVVATGGGVILRQENRINLRASGFVVYLNVPPHTLWERTRNDRNRPLLQIADPLLKLKELFSQRDPFYREVADLVVDASRSNAQAVLQLLVKEVGERWKL
ncbi:shikimate kinase [Propionivibrio sp.]|uniref:shikimate kinase n=1 Tax=Propionivibrio sp. TaxID=2212460 RepID=UPI00262D57DA|nr:shikimate kinase [Propionivibrio sp.]